ncbi:MAG: DNA-processing protein DprA [Alphaproteobacteria bacterium]|nr:DNA-processing protein DprA [Alphaproteobacteria bacterium]
MVNTEIIADITGDERRDRLRLFRSENVGPVTYRQLVGHYGSAGEALDALPALARRSGGRGGGRGGRAIKIYPADAARDELEALDRLGAQLLTLGEPNYPASLAAIDDAPPVLTVRGHAELLTQPSVAIVGARNASTNGRNLAKRLAADLSGADLSSQDLGDGAEGARYVVVSGLARGIDAAAHHGSLDAGGSTVAVMAGGVEVVYPPEHDALYMDICTAGAVISELPLGLRPQAAHFPRRNRIIAGLCLGVVVVEAATRSGSLITARLALEQGREVFAVPGSPLDPRSRGTNRLIRDGAILTETVADIRSGLSPMLAALPRAELDPPVLFEGLSSSEEDGLDSARNAIAACLSPTPVTVDEIVRQCQVTAPVVHTVILEMELAGLIERQPGNRIAAI